MTSGPATDVGEGTAYNDFVASLEFENVYPVSFRGERLRPGDSPETQYNITAAYSVEPPRAFFRYDVNAQMLGEDREPVGEVTAAAVLVVRFGVDVPEPHLIEQFGERNATLILYPFLRELVQSFAARLGFLGVLLPASLTPPLLPTE